MGRPQTNTVEYYSHDTNASEKRTVTILESIYGDTGYTFWFKLLEYLGKTEGHYYDARNPLDLEFLVRKLTKSQVSGTEILNKLAEMHAIDPILWEHKLIWCDNFVKRLHPVYVKRGRPLPKRPNICDSNCPSSHTMIVISEPDIPIPVSEQGFQHSESTQSKVKESKVKKENNIKKRISIEDFINQLKLDFPKIDVEDEIKNCELWYEGKRKKIKNHKLAYKNWMKNTMKFKGNGHGTNIVNTQKGNSQSADKYTTGKYADLIQR